MTAYKPGDPTTLNRLYGRSKGKKLRVEQSELFDSLLPQITIPAGGNLDSIALFGDSRP
jgi:tRNA (guanine-N7-)-methyltransferase